MTEDTKFVRVYDGVNSSLEGGWVMRAEDIKGLTDLQQQWIGDFRKSEEWSKNE